MSPDLSEIEAKLSRLESEPSPARDRDESEPGELSEKTADHLDRVLEEVENDPAASDQLEEIGETIRAEKEDESPEERRARRDRHELTEGEEALLDLLTGGSGEVKRR